MRRHPVAECLEQETEALPRLLLGDLLDRRIVDPDRPTTELDAIHDDVVGPGADRPGIAREQFEILRQGRGEGVVLVHTDGEFLILGVTPNTASEAARWQAVGLHLRVVHMVSLS